MFEGIVSETLLRYLGDYVKGLDSNNLKIALWNGDVILENLQIRKKGLNNLGLPIKLKSGFVGKLQLTVPWHNLKNAPIIVKLKDIFLIAQSKPESEWNEKDHENKQQAEKQDKLLKYEALLASENITHGTDAQQKGALAALVTKIVDNLQISVEGVHIRFEDDQQGFCGGITLEHITAHSTDENWVPTFLNSTHSVVHKLLSLKNLAVYWNTNYSPLKYSSLNKMHDLLDSLIYKDNQVQQLDEYIVNPVSANLKLTINKSNVPDKKIPKYSFHFDFEDLSLAMNETQYTQLQALLSWFDLYDKGQGYASSRPKIRPKGTEGVKLWWQFAYNKIVQQNKERKYRWTSEYQLKRREIKREYCTLFKKRKRGQLNVVENKRFKQLEEVLSYDDIVFFRSLVEIQLKKEGSELAGHQASQGWVSWMWSGISHYTVYGSNPNNNNNSVTMEESSDPSFDQTQRDKFFELIEYDIHQKEEHLDKDYVDQVFDLTMKSGSVNLKSASNKDVLTLSLEQFKTVISTRPNSTKVEASLSSLKVCDKYTKDTKFPYLVMPLKPSSNTPYLTFSFETNPLNSDFDYTLDLTMLPLQIVLNPLYFNYFNDLFMTNNSVIIFELEMAARRHLQRTKLSSVLENHKTIGLNINIQAPKVVMPESVLDSQSLAVVVDLGSLSFKSYSNNKPTWKNGRFSYKPEDFYDRFLVSLNDSQIVMGSILGLDSGSVIDIDADSRIQLLKKFDVNAILEYCIQTDVTLTQLKLYVDVPRIDVQLSSNALQLLIRIVNNIAKSAINSYTPTIPNPSLVIEPEAQNVEEPIPITTSSLVNSSKSNSSVEELVKRSRFLECGILLNEVTLTLNDNKRDIIKACIKELGSHIIQRTYDVEILLSLQEFFIEDQVYAGSDPQFAFIAQSEKFHETMTVAKLISIQSDSPEYDTRGDSLELYFNILHLFCNRETLIVLVNWVNAILPFLVELQKTLETTTPPTDLKKSKSTPRIPVVPAHKCLFKLTGELRCLDLTLLKEGKELVFYQMLNTSAMLEVYTSTMMAKGTVGGLYIRDLTPEGEKYPEIFTIVGDQMIDFMYTTYSVQDNKYPGHDALLYLNIHSVNVVYLKQFVTMVHEYVASIAALKNAVDTTASAAVEVAKETIIEESVKSLIKFEIDVHNPTIIIPRNSKSNSIVVVDLGHISFHTKFSLNQEFNTVIESMNPQVTNLSIYSTRQGSKTFILKEVNLTANIQRPIRPSSNLLPDIKLIIETTPIDICIAEDQYSLLLSIIRSHIPTSPSSAAPVENSTSPPSLFTVSLSAVVPRVSLQLFKRDHPADPTSPMFKCTLNSIALKLNKFSDLSIKLLASIDNLILEDTRVNHTNRFKKLIFAPLLDTEKVFRLEFKDQGHYACLRFHISQLQVNVVAEAIHAIFKFIEPGITLLRKVIAKRNLNKRVQTKKRTLEVIANLTDLCITAPRDPKSTYSPLLKLKTSIMITYLRSQDYKEFKLLNRQLLLEKYFPSLPNEKGIKIIEGFDFSVSTSKQIPNPSKVHCTIENPQLIISYQDVLIAKDIADSFISLKWEDDTVANTTQPKSPSQTETLIQIESLQATIVDESKDSCVPLFQFTLSESTVNILQKVIVIRTWLRLDYYNIKMTSWEPAIEPFNVAVKIDNSSSSTSAISVKSSQRLELTVTPDLFDAISFTLSVLKDYSNEVSTAVYRLHAPSYIIKNETGSKLKYWLTLNSSNHFDLDNHQEQALPVSTNSFLSRRTAVYNTTNIDTILLCFHVIPWNPITNLPLNRVGTLVLPLTPKVDEYKTHIIYDVQYKDISKVITVRSNIVVKNLTQNKVEIRLSQKNSAYGHTLDQIIDYEQSCSIPVEYCSNSVIQFKPLESIYRWSEQNIFLPDLPSVKSIQLFKCPSSLPTDSYFTLIQVTEIKHTFDNIEYVITLLPSLIIENLLCSTLFYKISDLSTGSLLHQSSIDSGQETQLNHVDLYQANLTNLKISLEHYDWSNGVTVENNSDIQTIQLLDAKKRPLYLEMVRSVTPTGARKITVYCRYWIVNNTNKKVLVRDHFIDDIASGQIQLENAEESIVSEVNAPLLYSYKDFHPIESKTCVKIDDSFWSKPISLESPGLEGTLEIPKKLENNTTSLYEVGISVHLAPDKFYRTKVITLSPRYIFVNNTDTTLFYKQNDTSQSFQLEPAQSAFWHWTSRDSYKEIKVSLRSHEWSCSFAIDQIGDFAIKIPKLKSYSEPHQDHYTTRINIKLDKSTVYVIFDPESKEFPPYRIENFTRATILVGQKLIGTKQPVNPYQVIPYTWDDPAKYHKISMEISGANYKKDYSLHILRKHKPHEITFPEGYGSKSNKTLLFQVEIFADGPTRVFRIVDLNIHKSESPSTNTPSKSKTSSMIQSTEFSVELEGIGVSLINTELSVPQELIYVTMEHIYGKFIRSKLHSSVEFYLETLQIDNQFHNNPTHPILFSSHNISDKIFQFSLVKSNQYESIEFYDYLSVLMQEVDINLDESLLIALINLLQPNVSKILTHLKEIPKRSTNKEVVSYVTPNKKLYFEVLHIHPIKVNLSYSAGSQSAALSSNSVLSTLLSAIGVTVGNVDGAQINLNTLLLQHAFTTEQELTSRISKHYYLQALREIYKIVGSFDIIGNPVSLVSNLGTGVYDFFYEPVQGLVRSPQDFARGIAKGTTSLVKNSVNGIFTTASKISGSLGKGLATLSMDSEFVKQREITARRKPKFVGEGIALGIQDFGNGVYKGVSSLFNEPLNAIQDQKNIQGIFTGVAKAILGATIKPVVGVIDFTTRTTQAISYTTATSSNKIQTRYRPPRFISPGKPLKPYSYEHSFGQHILLKTTSNNNEIYMFHCMIRNHIVLISNVSVFYLYKSSLKKKWSLNLSDIKKINQTKDSLLLFTVLTEEEEQDALFSDDKSYKKIRSNNAQVLDSIHRTLKELISQNVINM